MKYMGSKQRIAKFILPIMLQERTSESQYWVEPFVGGGNIIDKVTGNRICSDFDENAINALISIRDHHHELPKSNVEFTEEDYKAVKNGEPHKHKGYIGYALSFGAKWFGGWRRSSEGRDYVKEAYNSAANQSPNIQGVDLIHCDYRDLRIPQNSVIYCDPPYKNTTGYRASTDFNHEEFWQWCRDKAKQGHTVFVSEYNAPDDFECVWERDIVVSTSKNTGGSKRTKMGAEKLFRYKP